jgi:hypothetical protein
MEKLDPLFKWRDYVYYFKRKGVKVLRELINLKQGLVDAYKKLHKVETLKPRAVTLPTRIGFDLFEKQVQLEKCIMCILHAEKKPQTEDELLKRLLYLSQVLGEEEITKLEMVKEALKLQPLGILVSLEPELKEYMESRITEACESLERQKYLKKKIIKITENKTIKEQKEYKLTPSGKKEIISKPAAM